MSKHVLDQKTASISLDTIDALLNSANIQTRHHENSISFDGCIGHTRVAISSSNHKLPDGREISQIVRIASLLPDISIVFDELAQCLLNITASNSAVMVDHEGKPRVNSRISLYSGESQDVAHIYTGVIFLTAVMHTNAVQAALASASGLEIPKPPPPPESSREDVWDVESFYRTTALLRNTGAFANGDAEGLTAEFPWDPGAVSAFKNLTHGTAERTSLLRIERSEHPCLGNGLSCRLDLPLQLTDSDAFKHAVALNRTECEAIDGPPFMGAWTSKPGSGRPTFVSFWPNYLSHAIGVEMIASWHAARAHRTASWGRSQKL
jgi:hypothetical protein